MLLKRIAIVALMISAMGIVAQKKEVEQFRIKEGSKLIGGAINYNQSKFTNNNDWSPIDNKEQTALINLNYGVALNDNVVLGLKASYIMTRIEATDYDTNGFSSSQDTKNTNYIIGPYLKKYYPITKKLLFNVEGFAGLVKGKFEDFNYDSETKTNGYTLAIEPGLTLQISKKIALTANMGQIRHTSTEYSNDDVDVDYKADNTIFNFGLDNLTLGAIIIL